MNNKQTVPQPTMTRDEMIMAWDATKKTLAEAKTREMELRKQLISGLFKEDEEGTQHIELGNGYILKAGIKKTYKLGNEEVVTDALSQLEDRVAGKVVDWKPSLNKKVYLDLDDADRKVIDSVLTTAFGAPTLTLVEPKVEKQEIPTLVQ